VSVEQRRKASKCTSSTNAVNSATPVPSCVAAINRIPGGTPVTAAEFDFAIFAYAMVAGVAGGAFWGWTLRDEQ
jgi:hypothetical protein